MQKYTWKNYYCNTCVNIDAYAYCNELRRLHCRDMKCKGGGWAATCMARRLYAPDDCPLALHYRRQKGLINDLPVGGHPIYETPEEYTANSNNRDR
jgi:hypothetical protein